MKISSSVFSLPVPGHLSRPAKRDQISETQPAALLKASEIEFKFTVSKDTGKQIIVLLDKETGKVVGQIPFDLIQPHASTAEKGLFISQAI